MYIYIYVYIYIYIYIYIYLVNYLKAENNLAFFEVAFF